MGESGNSSASAYSNSITPSARLAGPAAPASTGTNWVGNSTTAIGGLTTAWGQFSAGRANQRLARINAAQARQQAAESLQAGQFSANRALSQENQAEGAATAAQAGGGTVAGAGTSGLARASDRATSNMDRFLIQLNARRQAYGYQSKAAIDTFQGKQEQVAGDLGAAETLLNTGDKLWQNADHAHRLEFA